MKRILVILWSVLLCTSISAQGLKSFKLPNGISVYIWEDSSSQSVYGEVAVRTGSVNDPIDHTGLAHYLEHVMFKGTTKIGALDWEKEAPLYQQIIAKYDEMAQAPDQESKDAIGKEINSLTVEAARYASFNEYANLIESIGGTGLNAATGYDVTYYHNTFPKNQLPKWIMLAYERFVNPVFRGFQTELETVYEEYNMYSDYSGYQAQQFMMSKVFEGTPYARDIIGLPEHLKNPQLSSLIQFYNDWYVPENMIVILVGDVNTKMAQRALSATFGRIPARPSPVSPEIEDTQISGRKFYSSKLSDSPSVEIAFKGVKCGHPDEIPLSVCMNLLSNDTETGLLDKLVIDGDLMGAYASTQTFRMLGRNMIVAVPFYDNAQRRFDQNKNVEKMVMKEVRKLAGGEVDENVVAAVKSSMMRVFELSMEDPESIASLIREIDLSGADFSRMLEYTRLVSEVSIDDIKRVASQYLTNDFIVVYNETGRPSRDNKITKPSYEPINPPAGVSSSYAQSFKATPSFPVEEKYVDWANVETRPVNDHSIIYYTQNPDNDVFSLVLRYGANKKMFPKLQYAARLINSAGIMAALNPHQLKQQYGLLGVTMRVSTTDDYMYVYLYGYESSLKDACILLTRTLMLPDLDEKQLSSVKGTELSSRMVRKDNANLLAAALREYAMYGDNSSYRTEVSDESILNMELSELTGNLINAAKYSAEIFYTGKMPFEDVYSILSTSLPLVEGELQSDSPVIREMAQYDENTVLFLPNADSQQSQIYFYIPVGDYDRSENVYRDAFNNYIGGGFNGIIMQEIREKNSMAYSAGGRVTSQQLPGSKTYFTGSVGTQNDKAVDAIKLYTSILRDLPLRPQNIDNIKSYLKQVALTSQPGTRETGPAIAEWEKEGYTEDPAKEEIPVIDALSFDDVVNYYRKNIQGKPMVIAVMGNPKFINSKDLEQFGKVVKVREDQLFNEEGKLF